MITNYSIALSYERSYTKSWSLYGIDNRREYLVDKQTDVDLCNKAIRCYDLTYINKTHFFNVARPRACRAYTFKDTNTTRGLKSFSFRSMEFFGISLSRFNSCKTSKKSNCIIFLIALSFQ